MHLWNGLSNFKIFNVIYTWKYLHNNKIYVSLDMFIQVFYSFVYHGDNVLPTYWGY